MNDSKRVNVSSQPFSQAVVFSFLIYQVIPLIQADEDDQLYFTGIILVFFGCINYTIHISQPRFKPLGDSPPGFRGSNNSRIYIETGVVVVISYVLLLGVNWSYIWLAVFPIIAIWFIFTLGNELNRQSGSQQHDDGEGSGSSEEGGKEAKRQEAAALVLYWVLCVMAQFHISDSLAISQFLLFFSFMLGALTRMMTRLALTRAAPGVAPASVFMRKASLLVLLATVHTFAAELLGENVMLFMLPELAPVLLWLSLHLDRHDGSFITADKIKSNRNVVAGFRAAVVAVVALLAVALSSMDEFVLSWCTKAMVSCCVSGFLLYYVVFMLLQWPQLKDSTVTAIVEEAVKLLKLWANILLIAAALLVSVFVAAFLHGLVEENVAEPVKKLVLNRQIIFQRLCDTFLKFIV